MLALSTESVRQGQHEQSAARKSRKEKAIKSLNVQPGPCPGDAMSMTRRGVRDELKVNEQILLQSVFFCQHPRGRRVAYKRLLILAACSQLRARAVSGPRV